MKTTLEPRDYLLLLVALGESAAASLIENDDDAMALRMAAANVELERLLEPYGWTVDCFWDQAELELTAMFAADYSGPLTKSR